MYEIGQEIRLELAPMLTLGCAPSLQRPACRNLYWLGARYCSPRTFTYRRHALKQLRPPRGCTCASLPQYELTEGIASLSNVFRVAEGIAILTALSYTALPLLKSRRTYEATPADDGLGTDEVRLGVMTVVSCLPLFNWLVSVLPEEKLQVCDFFVPKHALLGTIETLLGLWQAWVFAALEDEESAGLYYSLALLYGLPQLSAGFQQDWFSIATLIAGAAHVQVRWEWILARLSKRSVSIS